MITTLLELVSLKSQSDEEKNLEILLLRSQLAILERRQGKSLRISRAEKLTLAVLAFKLKSVTNRSTTTTVGRSNERSALHILVNRRVVGFVGASLMRKSQPVSQSGAST